MSHIKLDINTSMYSREWQVNGSSIPSHPCSNMPATNISFKTCIYLVLITLSISDGTRTPPCATLEKITIAYEKSVRSPIPINTDHLFFRNAFSLSSANHIDVLSRITAVFLSPFSVYAYEGNSARELPEFLTRFASLVAARNIFSFEL